MTAAAVERARVIRKAAWRLVPFLALLYFVSFLDRVNVGFAALTMNADIGLSASAFGLGAGIFFIGYILFAVPSNLMLQRIGAAKWMAIISIVWGGLSLSMAFIETPRQFYLLRLLLGGAESGFFPGVILYLSAWFPDEVRGRIIGHFFIAVPLSNVFGAPLSGWLLEHSLFGLQGWQTMFVIEALPAMLLGIVANFWLTDEPRHAAWLSPAQREVLAGAAVADRHALQAGTVGQALLSPYLWGLGLLYFFLVLSLYGFGFWAPQILRTIGSLTAGQTGWATAIPYVGAAGCMYFWARHSDRTRERTWHLVLPAFLGGAGFLLAGQSASIEGAVASFALAAIGIYAACPVFWTLPTRVLTGTAAAGGIALVNSIGNLAGYAGPLMMGWFKDRTGGYSAGLDLLAAGMIGAALLALALKKRTQH